MVINSRAGKIFFAGLGIVAFAIGASAFLFFERHPDEKLPFADIIESSGLPIEGYYGALGWGDYNGDGYADLLVRYKGRISLFRNNRNATFSDMTEAAGLVSTGHASGATFGDYDNDGCPDIFVANGFGEPSVPSALFRGRCDGTFSDAGAASGIVERAHARGMAWGDYNNDGYLDLYVATWGILNFIKTETSWEFDNWEFEPNMLYRNNGNGTFTNVSADARVEGLADCKSYTMFRDVPRARAERAGFGGESPYWPDNKFADLKNNWQPVWFDYDNDGLLDLYVSHETTINVLYHNLGDGTFEDVTEEAGLCQVGSTHGVAVGDYDNDGYLDIYSAGSRRSFFWRNNGNGTFSEVSEDTGTASFGLLAWSPLFFDYDNDGYLDLYSVNGSTGNASYKNDYPDQADRLYRNDGHGKFTNATMGSGISGNDAKTFGAFADANNDGFMDVFVLSDNDKNPTSTRNRLYLNTPNGNHWLTVKLRGTKSNKDGIGAVIIADVGGNKQMRQVISGASLMSQNSIWPTFGLGEARKIDTLTIRWPSGAEQVLSDTSADQILVVEEPLTR